MTQHQDATATFLRAFEHAMQQGTLIKCTLSKPAPGAEMDLKNVYLRPVELKKGLHIAFNFRYQTRDEVKNHPPEAALPLLKNLLGNGFLNADLLTPEADFSLQFDKAGQAVFTQKKASQPAPVDLKHNREKQRLLQPSAPWLHALGISSREGEILAKSQDKWRQINKYLEIIGSLLQEHPLPQNPKIADMGSGKGYLTFALYDYLTNTLGLAPQITGIELRPNLVQLCNEIAKDAAFEGLHFEALDIEAYAPERLDMLIALHACDTATDLALAAGILNHAGIIVAAPCCHKQIRRDMATQNELEPILRFGILEERQAEIVTDGIRALLLEAEGYHTKVFEFISTEHTAKNVMITATKTQRQSKEALQKRRKNALAQVEALKAGFGIKTHFLETKLSL